MNIFKIIKNILPKKKEVWIPTKEELYSIRNKKILVPGGDFYMYIETLKSIKTLNLKRSKFILNKSSIKVQDLYYVEDKYIDIKPTLKYLINLNKELSSTIPKLDKIKNYKEIVIYNYIIDWIDELFTTLQKLNTDR